MASEDIKFSGLDGGDPPAEAEDFIAAMKKCAFKEHKQRDNDWLCDFAATCFRGEALPWFAKLEMEDPQVVESWKLLRNAILTHYPRPAEKAEEDDASDMEFSVPISASSRPQSSTGEEPQRFLNFKGS